MSNKFVIFKKIIKVIIHDHYIFFLNIDIHKLKSYSSYPYFQVSEREKEMYFIFEKSVFRRMNALKFRLSIPLLLDIYDVTILLLL